MKGSSLLFYSISIAPSSCWLWGLVLGAPWGLPEQKLPGSQVGMANSHQASPPKTMGKGQFPKGELSITEGAAEGREFNPLAAPHPRCPKKTAQIPCRTFPAAPGAAGGDFAAFPWFWEKNSTESSWKCCWELAGRNGARKRAGRGKSPRLCCPQHQGRANPEELYGQSSPVLLLLFPPAFPGNQRVFTLTSGSLHQGEIQKSSSRLIL